MLGPDLNEVRVGTHKSGLTKRPHKESGANLKHLGMGREYQARTRNEVRVPAANYKRLLWSYNANREPELGEGSAANWALTKAASQSALTRNRART